MNIRSEKLLQACNYRVFDIRLQLDGIPITLLSILVFKSNNIRVTSSRLRNSGVLPPTIVPIDGTKIGPLFIVLILTLIDPILPVGYPGMIVEE